MVGDEAYEDYMVVAHGAELLPACPKDGLASAGVGCMGRLEDDSGGEEEPHHRRKPDLPADLRELHPQSPEANKAHRGKARAWLRTSPLGIVFLMLVLTAPLLWLLYSQLALHQEENLTRVWANHVNTEDMSFASLLAKGKWPLLVAAEGSQTTRFLDMVASLHEPSTFACFPSTVKKLWFQNLAFKMLSRQAAYITKHLVVPHRMPKYQVFSLLSSPASWEVAGECPKMRDDYSDGFIRYYGARQGGITSSDALFELFILIVLGITCTARIESLNAWLRRRLGIRSRSQQPLSLVQLSSSFVLSQYRCQSRAINQPHGIKEKKQRKTRIDAKSKPIKTKKRYDKAGGGGSWRAFISTRCKEISRACFRALAIEYRNLPDCDKKHFVKLGQQGSLAHKQGQKSFGLQPRALARALKTKNVMQRVRDTVAFASSSSTTLSCLALEDMRRTLADFTADSAIERYMAHESLNEKASDLLDWRSSNGARNLEACFVDLPGQARQADCFTPKPRGSINAFLSWAPNLKEDLPPLVNLLQEAEHQTVATALLERYEGKHKKIIHDDQDPIPKKKKRKASVKPECTDAWFCLCGVHGTRVWQLAMRIIARVKLLFHSPRLRLVLDGGDAVLRCSFTNEDPEDASSCLSVDFFVHIPIMYWKPYEPTWRTLTWPSCATTSLGYLKLRAEHKYCLLYDFSNQLCRATPETTWTFRTYKLHSFDSPLGVIDARDIVVQPLEAVELTCSEIGGREGQLPSRIEDALDQISCSDDSDEQYDIEDVSSNGDDWHLGNDGPNVRLDLSVGSNSCSKRSRSCRSYDTVDLFGSFPASGPASPDVSDEEVDAVMRGSAVAEFFTPYGKISQYKDGQLVAHCLNVDLHGCRCRRTRSTNEPTRETLDNLKGRPVGFLYAWLMASNHPDLRCASDHKTQVNPDRAARVLARTEFYMLDGGFDFANRVEWERSPDSDDEPQ